MKFKSIKDLYPVLLNVSSGARMKPALKKYVETHILATSLGVEAAEEKLFCPGHNETYAQCIFFLEG